MSVKLDTFGKGLKEARKKHGLKTQQDLVDALGKHGLPTALATVRNWEQGKTFPEAKALETLCDLFDCDMDYLFGRISCKTHDAQFVCDYTGLDEDAVESLHESLKNDSATMIVLSYLIRCNTLLSKLVNYYASRFDAVAKSRPFSLIPYDRQQVQQKFAYADILDALPEDAGMFFHNSQNNPTVTKEMVFKLIWGCVDDNQAVGLLDCLYNSQNEAGISLQLGMIANFLASNSFYADMAKRMGVNFEDFYCAEQEGADNVTD